MISPSIEAKVIEYLKEYPDAWTRDIHKAVFPKTKYWMFMAIMKQLESDGFKIVSKKHSNKNLTWRYRSTP